VLQYFGQRCPNLQLTLHAWSQSVDLYDFLYTAMQDATRAQHVVLMPHGTKLEHCSLR
jgi:hypothetical protein